MSVFGQLGGGDGPGWRRPLVRLPRPAGIRNGGLLLILAALAAVMALVDQPPERGLGGRLPGGVQHLPPAAGITGLPPTPGQPPPAADQAAPGGDASGRRASAARAHPRREHPRPARSGASGRQGPGSVSRPVGQDGSGDPRPPVTRPPVPTPPVEAAPAARVRVPPVRARVTPPALPGPLPGLQAQTPEVAVDLLGG